MKQGGKASRPRLSKRPSRALACGSLLEFPQPRSLTAVPWSVPAFLPTKASVGPPLLRLCPLSLATLLLRIERRQAASRPVAFNASPRSKGYASSDRPTNLECPRFLFPVKFTHDHPTPPPRAKKKERVPGTGRFISLSPSRCYFLNVSIQNHAHRLPTLFPAAYDRHLIEVNRHVQPFITNLDHLYQTFTFFGDNHDLMLTNWNRNALPRIIRTFQCSVKYPQINCCGIDIAWS